MKVFSKFLSSKYGPIIIGIAISAFLGLFINSQIQNSIINRQQEFEIYKRNLNSSEKIILDTVLLINERLFLLQRVFWAYQHGEKEDAKHDYFAYRNLIKKWSVVDMNYRLRLNMYLGGSIADEFYSSEIGGYNDNIYDKFSRAHGYILKWKTCLKKSCSNSDNNVCKTQECNKEKDLTEKSIVELRKAVNIFTEALYDKYNHLVNEKIT